MFNGVFMDYLKSKRRFLSTDDRYMQHLNTLRLHYDYNDCPLSKQKYLFTEIREDLNLHMRQRSRASLKNVVKTNLFEPLVQKAKMSLVPFK